MSQLYVARSLSRAAGIDVCVLVCAGQGSFSKVKTCEVKGLPAWLTKEHGIVADAAADALVPELHGHFVLKSYKKTEVARLKQVDHVKSESLIMGQISHPFIATLFHRYQDERHLYFILELVQGGELHTFIQRNGRLPNETARFVAAQTVMAIQYLHAEHIAYRDLNTENVMLDSKGVRGTTGRLSAEPPMRAAPFHSPWPARPLTPPPPPAPAWFSRSTSSSSTLGWPRS